MKWYLLPFRKYFVQQGRARRKEYWIFSAVNGILLFLVSSLQGGSGDGGVVGIFFLVLLAPSLTVAIRRMHDTGHSGIYILIPVYNIILACTEGTRGNNMYGPDPKAHERL
ncbi:MAG: DUF805 domain-containing protein [Candidatus Fermentibacteraceae bacterium]|nr:DUF805 domain-containing protein [Candidatus Fermentibacteraceae bacterium]